MAPEVGKKKQFGRAADKPVSNIAGAANKSNHNLTNTVSFFILFVFILLLTNFRVYGVTDKTDVCINEIYTFGNIGQD